MPPIEMRQGSFYSREGDSDFDELMERARNGELDAIKCETDSDTVYLFPPASDVDDGDLIPAAMFSGIFNGFDMVIGNRVIENGKEVE